jgi:2-iminoacetate synthase ThiH
MQNNNEELDERRRANLYERHLQTTIQIIIVAILLWFGTKTIATSDTVIRLETTVATLSEKVTDLQATVISTKNSRYTDADALNDRRVHELQEQIQTNRIVTLEKELSELSKYIESNSDWKGL